MNLQERIYKALLQFPSEKHVLRETVCAEVNKQLRKDSLQVEDLKLINKKLALMFRRQLINKSDSSVWLSTDARKTKPIFGQGVYSTLNKGVSKPRNNKGVPKPRNEIKTEAKRFYIKRDQMIPARKEFAPISAFVLADFWEIAKLFECAPLVRLS
jgi:hypothetical protein